MEKPTDFPMQQERVLTCGDTTIGILPEINLVSHFQVGNWPVLYRAIGTGNVRRWGMPLMIPNFSRLKDGLFEDKGTSLPMHGFGRLLPWSVTAQTPRSITLQLDSNETTHAQYPYDFRFLTHIEVSENTLTYTLTMENHSSEVMPIAPGFHPYFAVGQAEKAQVITDGPEGFAIDQFQWDTNPPDRLYPFTNHELNVQIPKGGFLSIRELPVNGSYSLAHLQIWSEPVTAPDHEFICFEPVVAGENSLNLKQERLNIQPGSSHQLILQLHARPFE
uniref:Aldose 1-epimerase n=1 Tax=Thermosporothrix sp. COM3 TaxID=2490863 RepID=A0A455SQU6_9CHLR|nr:hypothetical protein KTC_41500 [Thermosporothrix sp. COM3]